MGYPTRSMVLTQTKAMHSGGQRVGGHGSLWDSLNLSELDPEDVTLLTSTAWLWVLENAREGERLPSPEFIDALFESSGDPVFRLRIRGRSAHAPFV
jgi:hypothetical protein